MREISFASSPQDLQIQFGIESSSGSDYQKAFQSLAPGDTIEVFKIKGHMTWPPQSAHAVLIAGGIGVTPFRSMLRDRLQKNLPITTTLLHVSKDSFLYHDELLQLASEYKTSDRSELSNKLDALVEVDLHTHYYVAGSPGFVDTVTEALREKGVTTIETDAFKGLTEELV